MQWETAFESLIAACVEVNWKIVNNKHIYKEYVVVLETCQSVRLNFILYASIDMYHDTVHFLGNHQRETSRFKTFMISFNVLTMKWWSAGLPVSFLTRWWLHYCLPTEKKKRFSHFHVVLVFHCQWKSLPKLPGNTDVEENGFHTKPAFKFLHSWFN